MSSKDSENPEKSLCARDKAGTQYWMIMDDDIEIDTYGKNYMNVIQKLCCLLRAKAHLKWTETKWK